MSKTLPPLPHWCEPGSPFAEQMQAYATAAVEALRAQIGRGVLDALDNFEKKERSPLQAYLLAGMVNELVNELRTALVVSTTPAPQQQLTDEQIVAAYCKERRMWHYVEAYLAGARFAEAAHNIGAKK